MLRARSPLPGAAMASEREESSMIKEVQKSRQSLRKRHGTPLPALQLAVLMGVRLAEPSECCIDHADGSRLHGHLPFRERIRLDDRRHG